ncbi:MAG: uL15 family ribosomal protein [Ignisphaera sp.]|uniref:Large ribosomal subunit protein uL15 n=1 Tax=Ignisphaera aggregans TaxID=334771 RepID=A0A7C4JIZ7_9CREN
MVVRKEKKSRKMHGYRNRGWGSIGQHRKSGSRGGRGASGMHKHKWSWVIKYFRDWFGKKGFTPRGSKHWEEMKIMDLRQLNEFVEKLIQSSQAVYEGGKIVVNLSEVGITKVVGDGEIKHPVKVIVYKTTKSAKNKIEAAGGIVVPLYSKQTE